jgi:sortase A
VDTLRRDRSESIPTPIEGTAGLRAGCGSIVSGVTDQLAADERDAEPGGSASGAPSPGGDRADGDTGDVGGPSGRPERISKWDRPPEPHDWRFFVGNAGRVLIATGLLMFGFVAYQLWGTGIETARAQNELENQFEDLIAAFAAGDDDVRPADASGDTPDEPGGDEPDTETSDATAVDAPGTDDAAPEPAPDGDREPADATADAEIPDGEVPVAADLADEAIEQDIPPIVRGDVLARLEIPAIDRVDYVVPGVSLEDLKRGPGHYPDTPLPGQLGNAAVAGHRTTYGAPFFDVDQLEPSDEIIVTMANGDRFVYEVTGVQVVEASDYWVVATSNPDAAELTLTSCHPKYTARDRIVVHSVLNPAKSSNVGVPTFYELEPDDTPIPGDDPVLDAGDEAELGSDDAVEPSADDAVDGEDTADTGRADEVDEVEESDEADEATGVPAAEPPRGTRQGAELSTVPSGQVEDAFSQGWFHDMSAFPQIALWGTALTIISLAAYAVSRRFRHDSIGFLVGIVPFLVALYFFFQNVNRLLPPGL